MVRRVFFKLSIQKADLYTVPKFHDVLGTSTVPVEYWFLPMGYGMGLLLLDEGRKSLVRTYAGGFFAKIGW